MNITIHSVEREQDEMGNCYFVASFNVEQCSYTHALNDTFLDRSSIDLNNDTCDAVDEAIAAFMRDRGVDPEAYDIDELSAQAQLFGYIQGKRFVLDQVGHSIELVELTERARKRVGAFDTRAEFALWLRGKLDDPGLEKGAVKRVNANIPEALHDDFKALCVRRKVDMQDMLAKLIINWMQ
jgi:transcriptional regulator of met regulon